MVNALLKRYRRDFLFLLILLGVVVLYFSPVIFSDNTFASRDIYKFFNPRQFFAAEMVRSGEIPLWNPYVACGVPFLANLQCSIFYPLSSIYYILPFQLGFKYFIIIHYFLGSCFMYLLMRYWGYSHYAALLSGIVFSFGGYLASLLDYVAFLTSCIWLPLVLLLFDKCLKELNFTYAIFSGIAISLQIFGGDLSFYLISTFMLLSIYLAFHLVNRTLTHIQRLRMVRLFIVAWLVGLTLPMVMIAPFIEFVSLSTRVKGLTYAAVTKWSFNPLELLELLIPYLFGKLVPFTRWCGQQWLDTIYIGILPLLLVLMGVLCTRGKLIHVIVTTSFISLLLSFGQYNPLFPLIYKYFPPVTLVHFPVKFFYLVHVSLSLLAGMGVEWLCVSSNLKNRLARIITLMAACGGAFLLMYGALIIEKDSAISLLDRFSSSLFGFNLFYRHDPEVVYYGIVSSFSNMLVIYGTLVIIFFLFIKQRIKRGMFKCMLLIMLLLDLFLIAKPDDPIIPSNLYTYENNTVRFLKADSSPYRIFSLGTRPFHTYLNEPGVPFTTMFRLHQDTLHPNLGMYFHVFDIDEFSEIKRQEYYQIFKPLTEHIVKKELNEREVHYIKKVLDIMSVRYVIGYEEVHHPDLTLIKGKKWFKIYENRGYLPRVYLVPYAVVHQDNKTLLNSLCSDQFDHRNSILITTDEHEKIKEEFTKDQSNQTDIFQGEAHIIAYTPQEVTVAATSNAPCFLTLTDNHYPGWKVYVDGVEKTLFHSNYIFRGVVMGSGEHVVRFSFQPLSFRIGAVVSLVMLLFIVMYFILHGRSLALQGQLPQR